MKQERKLFDLYYPIIYQISFYIVKDKNLADDVVQDTFVKVFAHLDSLEDPTKMDAWVKTIARRTALDHLRKQKKWNERTVEDVYMEKADVEKDSEIETDLNQKELKEEIMQAIDELRPDYRILFLLKFIEDYTDDEIAQELHMKTGTVKSRIHRAKEIIKRKLQKGGGLDEVE